MRGTGRNGGACSLCSERRIRSIRSVRPATVGASNRLRSGTSTSIASRTRDMTCVASNECPPSSKKSSCTPTRSSPSTSAQIPATSSSDGLRGASQACSSSGRSRPGAGNA